MGDCEERDQLCTDSAFARLKYLERCKRRFGLDAEELPDLEAAILAEADRCADGCRQGKPVLTCMADVEPERVRWLWPQRIARGKLSILAGDPGLGKSTITADFASRVTNGLSWPDGGANDDGPGGVVILSAEDGASDTIVPRLIAAQADRSRVYMLDGVRSGEDDQFFDLRAHLPVLAKAVESIESCKLVVIDPIGAFLGMTDSHRDADVRGVLKPVAAMAEKLDVAVLAVAHLNKGRGAAIYRTMGSLAFVAAARSAWGVVRDKSDPAARLFVPIKNNLGPDKGGLRFRVVDLDGAPVLNWEKDRIDVTADEAMEEPPMGERGGDRRKAGDWLKTVLADGPVPVRDLQRLAKEDGFSWATIRRAQADAGAIDFREGFGAGSKSLWRLPPSDGEETPDF